MHPLLQINGLHRSYKKTQILSNINAQLNEGDVVALLGKNGAGKTSLLETILGLALPEQGEVRLFGTLSSDIGDIEKQKIGFVPQQDELLEQLTAQEHITLFSQFQPNWQTDFCYRLISNWEIPTTRAIAKLSIGQRQKLSIILALCHRPKLLLLDEPVASLDPIARRQFLSELVEIATDQQTAIIFSSHIVTDMERIANKVWLIKDQHLVWQDDLDQLKESVVRLHIVSDHPLPATLPIANMLHQQVKGNVATACVNHWQPQQLLIIEQQLSAAIHIEFLNLEDIFLELHR